MDKLIDDSQLIRILERGLLSGKWSIAQFNKGNTQAHLPTDNFLKEHPEFQDFNFRDLKTFNEQHGKNNSSYLS